MQSFFRSLGSRGWLPGLCLLIALLAGCVSAPVLDGPRRIEAEGRVIEALHAYEQIALTVTGANRALVDGEIRRLRRGITQEALGQAAAALGAADRLPLVDAALAKLQAKLPYDDDSRRLAAEEGRVQGVRTALQREQEKALSAADRAAEIANWSTALEQLAVSERIFGSGQIFAERRQRWLGKRDDGMALAIRNAISARDLALARKLVGDMATLKPVAGAELIGKLRIEVEGLRRILFIEEQRALIAKNHFFTSYRNLIGEDFLAANELVEQVRKDGAGFYLEVVQRERAGENTRIGFAYFAAVKALELDGKRDDVFTAHRELADAIENFITIRVAVAGFESPAASPGLGGQVSDALITYLIDHLPHGVRVIERAQIDQAMSGKGADLTALGRQLNAEVVVVGNVSSLNVERKRFEREVTEIVQVGTQKEPNPLFAQMALKHGANTAEWPFAVAPLLDGAPIMETIRYKQGEEVLNGVMVAYVRSVEVAGGTVLQSREFSTTENFKDGFRDAVPMANITYDALELPTDNEVRERLRARLAEQIAAEVLKRYDGRERRYFGDAEQALKRRETELAVLNLAAAHHYSTVATAAIEGGRKNPVVARIDQFGLFELTE